MRSTLIHFKKHHDDLKVMPEMWVGENFAKREKKILENFSNRTHGLPSSNMNYVRFCSIPIREETTLKDLRELCHQIKKSMGIECFQIAVDRPKKVAHLLFDFYDKERGECYYIYKTKQKEFLVMVIRTLDLEFSMVPSSWLRHFFIGEFRSNPNIFQENMLLLRNSLPVLGKRSYRFINDTLRYVELICKGITRGAPI